MFFKYLVVLVMSIINVINKVMGKKIQVKRHNLFRRLDDTLAVCSETAFFRKSVATRKSQLIITANP